MVAVEETGTLEEVLRIESESHDADESEGMIHKRN